MTIGVIAYLRASKTDQIASEQALADQQASLFRWLAENKFEVVRQFIEVEGKRPERPRLAEAIEACRQLGIPLLIVSVQPIGAGLPFHPRIASVPVIVLPQRQQEAPRIIACPRGCLADVHLRVDKMTGCCLPLYLCNPNNIAIGKVTVRGSGLQLGTTALSVTCPSLRSFDCIAPRTCVLLEQRDINLEGDFLDCLQIAFDQAGVGRKGAALLRSLLDTTGPIPIRFEPR